VDRIVARNSGTRNVVEERQLPRAALFFGEQASILHGNRDLARRGHEDVYVALFENVLPHGAHGDHYASGLAAQQDGSGAEALGGLFGAVGDAQSSPRLLQVGTDEEGLAGANHIFSEGVLKFAPALRQDEIILDL